MLSGLLIGCTHPSTVGEPKARPVNIPQDCIDLAADVEQPAVTTERDSDLATVQTSAALATARGNLKATRDCQIEQQARYGGAS